MTLNFQNRIVFPAPETSYTSETAYGQVVYIPRNIQLWPKKTRAATIDTQSTSPQTREEEVNNN